VNFNARKFDAYFSGKTATLVNIAAKKFLKLPDWLVCSKKSSKINVVMVTKHL